MTTSQSPLSSLKAQAAKIAIILKAAERGEKMTGPFAERLVQARTKPAVKFAVVMDDKILSVEMTWERVRETSEVGLAEWIVKQMIAGP